MSGIEFTVDTTKAYDQGEQYPGSTYYGPKSIQRVTIETVGGEPFDANATYTIATNDFMAAGGIPTMRSRLPPSTMTWASPWMRWSWTISPTS